MKRMISLLLALGLALALAACDKVPSEAKPDGGSTPPPATQPAGDDGSSSAPDVVLPDSDGFADGFMGDTMRTCFFDFTVNSAYTCAEYEGYVPSEGNTLLVADVTFYNYTTYSVPMYDTDLQAQWDGDAEEDFALPVTYARQEIYPNTGVEPMGDMFPVEFDLGIAQSKQGLLVYEVPAGKADYSLSYQELFDDDTTGDTFFVYFTPEAR
ncbi:MAG: DUF4352 domain-containing protein [Oscillospiraceae bacterium]|nr:DUF4352 domain-containing protein [Oscillospiraceae bacterium]